MVENLILPGIAVVLLAAGLIGQGFEMRKIRKSSTPDGYAGSPNIFLDKKNVKWYILIVAGIGLWITTGGFSP